MKNYFKKWPILIFLFVVLFPAAVALAQTVIYTKLPGEPQTGTDIGGYVNYLYKFALMISGILAFGAIVYGGVKYTLAAGNPSGQSEGKEWVKGALTGLLLLAGAYTILNVINPNLVNWNLPKLTGFTAREAAPSTGGGGTGSCCVSLGSIVVSPPIGTIVCDNSSNNCANITCVPGSCYYTGGGGGGTGCAGGTCQTLPNCTPSAVTNCGGAQGLVDALNCIKQIDPNFTVNEGYPPKVTHSDQKHYNGCAADLHVSSCAQLPALTAAAQSCKNSGTVSSYVNEYANCGGTTLETTTGGNFHVDATGGGC